MRWILAVVALSLLAAAVVYSSLTAGAVVECAPAEKREIREFVDEQAQTRLPIAHLITTPFEGRVEAVALAEGNAVKKGDVVATLVPRDLELSLEEAQAAKRRLDASIRESGDKSVEKTTWTQSLEYVKSMVARVQAAQARVESGLAKLDYANKTLARIRALRELNNASEDQLNSAELSQVEAQVDYRQDQLVLKALEAMLAATQLVPTVVERYMDRKDLTVAVLENERAQADVRLRIEQRDMERGVMRSPVDGVVLERLEQNERFLPGGTVLLKIGATEQLEVEADVLSQDVGRVRAGQEVEIYGPAVGSEAVRGTVDRIYPAGFTKVSSLGVEQQRVKVIVRFASADLVRLVAERKLGVGYRVRVRIFTQVKPQALVVPRASLFRGPDGRWRVFALRDGRARQVVVEVGLMNDQAVEIAGGVNEGELVVLAPESTLVDGTRIRPAETGGNSQ